jgi:MipA family protein
MMCSRPSLLSRTLSRTLLSICLAWPCAAAADGVPLWEAGLGVAPITFPEYRGADRQRAFVLPLPYFIYRGELLQVDRGGIRGLLAEWRDFEIDLSIDGAVPVRSSADGPRAGMPDLDPIVEFGPSLNWILQASDTGSVRIRLPVRAAIAADVRSVSHAGWKFHPHLQVQRERTWSSSLSIGPLFGSSAYHDYYYRVAPEFATDERPAFRSPGGYSGWVVLASASRRIDRAWLGAFMRYDNLAAARFADSPLVETRHAVMAGVGVAWIFRQSERNVPAIRWRAPIAVSPD